MPNRTGTLRFQVIDHDAHHDTQQGTGKYRGCNHQAFLLGIQPQVFGDLHAQGPEDHSDHEGEIEIQKRRKERWRMPRFPERGFHRLPLKLNRDLFAHHAHREGFHATFVRCDRATLFQFDIPVV